MSKRQTRSRKYDQGKKVHKNLTFKHQMTQLQVNDALGFKFIQMLKNTHEHKYKTNYNNQNNSNNNNNFKSKNMKEQMIEQFDQNQQWIISQDLGITKLHFLFQNLEQARIVRLKIKNIKANETYNYKFPLKNQISNILNVHYPKLIELDLSNTLFYSCQFLQSSNIASDSLRIIILNNCQIINTKSLRKLNFPNLKQITMFSNGITPNIDFLHQMNNLKDVKLAFTKYHMNNSIDFQELLDYFVWYQQQIKIFATKNLQTFKEKDQKNKGLSLSSFSRNNENKKFKEKLMKESQNIQILSPFINLLNQRYQLPIQRLLDYSNYKWFLMNKQYVFEKQKLRPQGNIALDTYLQKAIQNILNRNIIWGGWNNWNGWRANVRTANYTPARPM